MAKNKTVIKKPSGAGNISITIENNLKSTNTSQPVKRMRKAQRKQKATNNVADNIAEQLALRASGRTGGVGGSGDGGDGPDVSYIKPPSGNFTIWREPYDSQNTTIPISQAQQLGLTRPSTSQQLSGGTTVNVMPSENNESLQRQIDALTQRSNTKLYQRYDFDDDDENVIDDDREDVISRANTDYFNYVNKTLAAVESSGTPEEEKQEIAEILAIGSIAAARKAGTTQGERGVEPFGKYIDYPEFKESYNIALAKRLRTNESNRKNYSSLKGKKLVLEPIKEESKNELYAKGFAFYMRNGNIEDHPDKENKYFIKGYNDSRVAEEAEEAGAA